MTAVQESIAPFEIAKVRPQMVSRGKSSESLVRANGLGIGVQVLSSDAGETNLHSHPGTDSAWMVLDGAAKFYSTDDRLLGELGKNEIISIPAGAPYWFEAAGDGPCVILHITARDKDLKGESRIDYSPRTVGGENRVREMIEGKFFGD